MFRGKINHSTVAKLLYRMLGDKFVVDKVTDGKCEQYYWYEFMTKNDKMKKGQIYKFRKELRPDGIHRYISNELPEIYESVIEGYRKREKENWRRRKRLLSEERK